MKESRCVLTKPKLTFHKALTMHRQDCWRHRKISSHNILSASPSVTDFGSDFSSAMPEKPQQSLEDRMNQSADDFIVNFESLLGDNVEPPPELQALKDARRNNASVEEITLKVYELMIERGMRYDEDPDSGGNLRPTNFDIPNNLDVPEVKAEFAHLYKYGMMLMDRGLLTSSQVKETVIERLIKRTGLTPEKFDEWLGY